MMDMSWWTEYSFVNPIAFFLSLPYMCPCVWESHWLLFGSRWEGWVTERSCDQSHVKPATVHPQCRCQQGSLFKSRTAMRSGMITRRRRHPTRTGPEPDLARVALQTVQTWALRILSNIFEPSQKKRHVEHLVIHVVMLFFFLSFFFLNVARWLYSDNSEHKHTQRIN